MDARHGMVMDMDPKALMASEETLVSIEAACRRRFPCGEEADECYIHVLEGLQEDDFRRLRGFKGRSAIKTYLHAVVQALISDFKRHRYGRKRIPKTVSILGPWAETVYRLVCWLGFSYTEAYDIVVVESLYRGAFPGFVEACAPIRQAPCRQNPSFVSGETLSQSPALTAVDESANPLERLIEKLDSHRRVKALQIIREMTSSLSEEDRLLVRLVYGEDVSVRQAAQVSGCSPTGAQKRLRALLARFREALLAEGIREP